jgi:signal transduction histidine kinase
MDNAEPGLPAVVRTVVATARRVFTSLHSQHGGDEVLRRAASVLTLTGEAFLPAVVREVADMLDADVAFVGELTGTDRLRTVASWRNGAPGDRVEYSLAGSPLERTGDRSMRSYYSCVRVHFPDDAALAALDADGYIALPLVGTRDDIVGAIVAVTRRPLNNEAGARSLLQLLAGRVAAELERARTGRELRKSEHHLLQVQRVEAIGWLAGNIAHDFNNLLMIVIGYGEILQDRANTPEVSELLAAARRASTLTKQLLAFGRRQVMQVQRVDINRVVSQVQAMLARVVGPDVRLTMTLDASIPSVEVDPGQLE